jgi:hypothetical protein
MCGKKRGGGTKNETALLETKRKPEGNFFHRRLADSFIPNQDRLRTALGYSGRLRVAAGFLLNLSGCLNVLFGCGIGRGGNQSGLLVNNNLCHNVSSFSYGGWGLYNDQTTTSVTHTNNVIYGTEDACCAFGCSASYNITSRQPQ